MPLSDPYFKRETAALLAAMDPPPATVLDVGAGAGLWLDALRPQLPGARIVAVEIFEPYVAGFMLLDRYDEVVVGDIRQMALPDIDAIILGDVLEHMPVEDAVVLWNRCLDVARVVVLAIPLGPYPQDAIDGNEHERHLATWEHLDVLERLDGIHSYHIGSVVGVYLAKGARDA